MINLITATDSYKLSQFEQYPEGTEHVYSYIESRGGEYDEIVFLGIEYYLCNVELYITPQMVHEAKELAKLHGLPFNLEGWNYILKEYDGELPLKISALPEGTIVKPNTVMVTLVNTDPKCAWLTSYMETALLRAIWYPTTIATLSRECKKTINEYLVKTGTPELLPFKLHDFGARGATSHESACLAAMAHLVNFQGTDTFEALQVIKDSYCLDANDMPGFSIPASEHSTITSWGQPNEIEAFKNMIDKFGGGTYACVSDSYNIWAAIEMWKELEPLILTKGGTLIIRPDSGHPVHTPIKVVVKCLEEFGYTVNKKGYQVLPDHIRVIQGDGVNPRNIFEILSVLETLKISADNIAFGMGGELHQKVNRDTLKFAMKCSAIKVKGETTWRDVFKDPIGDPSKKSKKGLIYPSTDGTMKTMSCPLIEAVEDNVLVVYYEDGEHLSEGSFEDIRKRAAI